MLLSSIGYMCSGVPKKSTGVLSTGASIDASISGEHSLEHLPRPRAALISATTQLAVILAPIQHVVSQVTS